LPPVQQGSEFHSLDTASDSKTQNQPVEMGFYSSQCHLELGGDFGVVTTLQKQFNHLLLARTKSLARTEPNGRVFHFILPIFVSLADQAHARRFRNIHFCFFL
jgi:hypothetical protein